MQGDVSFTFLDRIEEVELNIVDRRWQSALALALTLPDIWIVTEDMTRQPNQPWRADRTTPVILITGNPDAVEIKKNSGKLTVLSMPLSIVDLRKTVEIYVS